MSKQLKIVLGEELRAELDKACAVSGASLAEEIRRRLWISFGFPYLGPKMFQEIDYALEKRQIPESRLV